MFICVCNAITEDELRQKARLTGGDVESVYAAMGKRPNCGQCLDDAEEMIFQERLAAVPNTVAA